MGAATDSVVLRGVDTLALGRPSPHYVGYKGSLLNQSFTVLYLPVLPVPALPPTHAFMQHITHTLMVLTGIRASHGGVWKATHVGLLAVLHNGPHFLF